MKPLKAVSLLIALLFIVQTAFAKDMKIRTSDGVELHVTVKGSGIPCVYMHGGPGSGAFWLEYFSGKMLEKRFQMIYIDQRGVSRSTSAPNGDYSLNRMIADFEEVRKFLGIDKWVTLGHSFGGVLQMAYSEQYPASVSGMMLLNCTLNLNESIESMINYALNEVRPQNPSAYKDTTKYPLDRLSPLMEMMRAQGKFWKFHYKTERNYHVMDSVMNMVPDWNGEYSGKAMFIGDYYKNFKPVTASVKVPVLFFYGSRDYAVGMHHYKGVKFPNALMWKYEGGHVPFMEGEKELETAIDAYLKKYRKQLET